MSSTAPETTRCDARIGEPPECETARRRLLLGRKTAVLAALGMVLVAGVAGLGGCASESIAVGEAGVGQPSPEPGRTPPTRLANADLPVVNCQLPPTIRRLGIDLTYLGAPRQIRTTARDCAIRGGDPSPVDTATRA